MSKQHPSSKPSTPRLTRREFLRLIPVAGVGAVLAACAPQSSPESAAPSLPPVPAATITPTSTFTPEPTATATSTPTETPIPNSPSLVDLLNKAKNQGIEVERYSIDGNQLIYDGKAILTVKEVEGKKMAVYADETSDAFESLSFKNMTQFTRNEQKVLVAGDKKTTLVGASRLFTEGIHTEIPKDGLKAYKKHVERLGGGLSLIDGAPAFVATLSKVVDGATVTADVQLVKMNQEKKWTLHVTPSREWYPTNQGNIPNYIPKETTGQSNQEAYTEYDRVSQEEMALVDPKTMPTVNIIEWNETFPDTPISGKTWEMDFDTRNIEQKNQFVTVAMSGDDGVMLSAVGNFIGQIPSVIHDEEKLNTFGRKSGEMQISQSFEGVLEGKNVGSGMSEEENRLKYHTGLTMKVFFTDSTNKNPNYRYPEEFTRSVWVGTMGLIKTLNQRFKKDIVVPSSFAIVGKQEWQQMWVNFISQPIAAYWIEYF